MAAGQLRCSATGPLLNESPAHLKHIFVSPMTKRSRTCTVLFPSCFPKSFRVWFSACAPQLLACTLPLFRQLSCYVKDYSCLALSKSGSWRVFRFGRVSGCYSVGSWAARAAFRLAFKCHKIFRLEIMGSCHSFLPGRQKEPPQPKSTRLHELRTFFQNVIVFFGHNI